MTMQEFKAWFEGFTESMSGPPNKKQWERIKERVGQIDGVATTQRIFIDRYWPTYIPTVYPHYPYYPYSISGIASGTVFNNTVPSDTVAVSNVALYQLGQVDASVM